MSLPVYDRQKAAEEFAAYYRDMPEDGEALRPRLEALYRAGEGLSSYARKANNIQYLCEHCTVKVFRNSPFFHEFSSGRARYSWGGTGGGTFLQDVTADKWLDPYREEMLPDLEAGRLICWNNPVSFDHHSLGYDTILTKGFNGILAEAESALAAAGQEKAKEFYRACIQSCRALLTLAGRFAAEARRLAALAADTEEQTHYLTVAQLADRVPAHPAATAAEALAAVIFCREAIGTLEGVGVSTFGHLDRMLYPYYAADLAAGRLDAAGLKNLLHLLFTYTDARFDVHNGFHETSTTVIIGGCDARGGTVCNAVTYAVLDTLLEGRYVNTKVNCRVSSAHPTAYLQKYAEVQTADIPTIVLQNDDVIIPARVKCGEAEEDARTYVSGGCHEITLQNCEVNHRADTWINLPKQLLETLEESSAPTFEAFYAEVLAHIKTFLRSVMRRKNKYEAFWCKYCPLPLLSSTMTGCLEKGLDATEGGTKYAQTALSLLTPATMVDSLWSVKTLVYERRELTLREMSRLCQTDFADNERLRSFIVHRLPKYGTGDPQVDAFAAAFLRDVSALYRDEDGSLYKNARGGDYLPAFYIHDCFRALGYVTGATPDGRRAHEPISRGCSPSEFVEVRNPADILYTVGRLDFTDFADSFVTELTLQRMQPEIGIPALVALIRLFLQNGGSSLQFNMLDKETLLDARVHPERHRDLCVRVCGYSAVFVTLAPDAQDEIISRAIR